MRSRERIIRVILLILSRPDHYTRKALAARFKVSKNTIDSDIKEIEAAGLDFQQKNSANRCSIIPNSNFKELQYLMPLSTSDQAKIATLIDKAIGSKAEASYLKKKLYSLYDFQRLGIRALRRPELEKIDSLKTAESQKLQACLENYRSNSNRTRDRLVEPFHIDTEHNTLQAFDVHDEAIRHFKLNRMRRVVITQTPWEFEKRHFIKYTDVFRIANNKTQNVHLELDALAYNSLIENYPQSLAYTMPGAKSDTFNFQAKVNTRFLGLTNFIMGNRGHVKILDPDILKEHILEEAQKIIDHLTEEK